MTEKELHKLHKTELLEMMLEMRTELDRVREENTVLEQKVGGDKCTACLA